MKYFSFFLFFICSVGGIKGQLTNCSVNAGIGGKWCNGDTIILDGNVSGFINPGTIKWEQIGGSRRIRQSLHRQDHHQMS